MTVNGFVNTNGITLNISSGKALNTVVGHEIMHVLEGSGMYDSLAEAVEAVDPKAFADRLEQLTKLYSGREGYTGEDAARKIRQEVVADLVGDYLFTDRAFVEQLSTEKPGVFRKAFEEIKYPARWLPRAASRPGSWRR